MKLLAPAKINLYLEIISKRQDGYHNLESVMHTVSLCDELEFLASDKIELICDKDVCSPEKNLVYKTAVKLKEKYSLNNKGVKIILKKNIPTGAGLGGGSSDAAATILALNKYWNLNLSKKELEEFAATIGADVPFFLTGGTAKIEGIGDIVKKIKVNDKYHFVLVKPDFGVSTVEAYSKIKMPLTNINKFNKIIEMLESCRLDKAISKDLFFNRFESTVFSDYPEIQKIKSVLSDLGAVSLMSGSGATVFGLVSDEQEAKCIAEQLKKYTWKVWIVNSFEVHINDELEG